MENNKPRLESTHFVEVWRLVKSSSTHCTRNLPISMLPSTLKMTSSDGVLETILVAKIKFKNNDKK